MIKLPTVEQVARELRLINLNTEARHGRGVPLVLFAWPGGEWMINTPPISRYTRGAWRASGRVPGINAQGIVPDMDYQAAARKLVAKIERAAARTVAKIRKTYGIDVG